MPDTKLRPTSTMKSKDKSIKQSKDSAMLTPQIPIWISFSLN